MILAAKINTITKFLRAGEVLRVAFIGLILCNSSPFLCWSQDLYNMEHTRKYAEYLFSGRQYTLAAEEYERLIYINKYDVRFKLNLIKSYRLSGDFNSGISRIYSFYNDSLYTMPHVLATEFLKLELLTDSLPVAQDFMQQCSSLSIENKAVFECFSLLLEGKYNEAGLYVREGVEKNRMFPSDLVLLTEKAGRTRFKHPVVAGGFSAIIPGTGKFYTKNWADGVFSMLFVAGNAWQAYRGFNKYGSKSAYAWTFAGLSAGFYIGNIFGSVKAAKRYNKNKRNEIDTRVFEIIHSDNF